MKLDDVTYVYIHNLLRYLKHFSTNKPYWLGCPLKLGGGDLFTSGGQVFVFCFCVWFLVCF